MNVVSESTFRSASEVVRVSLREMRDMSWSPWDAAEHVEEERNALDGCVPAYSHFRYRTTPWVSLTVQLRPSLLEAVRSEAQRLSVGSEALVRAALFQFLLHHFDHKLPSDQLQPLADRQLGYSNFTSQDGSRVDPRHPDNAGREQEAAQRLRQRAEDPDAHDAYRAIQRAYQEFLRNLQQKYDTFISSHQGPDDGEQR